MGVISKRSESSGVRNTNTKHLKIAMAFVCKNILLKYTNTKL